jgi:hypothetical protein
MLAVCGENLVSFTLNKPNHFGCGMVNMIAATATNGGSVKEIYHIIALPLYFPLYIPQTTITT